MITSGILAKKTFMKIAEVGKRFLKFIGNGLTKRNLFK